MADDRTPKAARPSLSRQLLPAVHGLLARPRTLPWQYFYDELGSRLFEKICNLPEYYLTRTEDAILRDHARAMVSGWSQPPTLIELGSGSAGSAANPKDGESAAVNSALMDSSYLPREYNAMPSPIQRRGEVGKRSVAC